MIPAPNPNLIRMIVNGRFFTGLTIFLLMVLASINLYAQTNIILDTDIGSDCDDVGAMAVLHKLADKGEANILGVVFSSGKNKYGIGVCDAINTYYGRGYLPLGQYKGNDIGDPKNHYSKEIATAQNVYHNAVVDSAPELIKTYINILQKQPDSSVTIVTIGHPYGLVLLMNDQLGFFLIKQKVKKWVAMTGTKTIPARDWNFGMNGVEYYIHDLLKNWPTDAYFSSIGKEIITGNKKLPLTPMNNPVREAYKLWNNALSNGRYSWDQVAILYAVRPKYFKIDSFGTLEQNDKFQTYWNSKVNNPKHHRIISLKISNARAEKIIEDLMSELPSKK